MPRPTDTYTHDQFEKIDSVTIGGTVRCRHCKRWQGSARVLLRKKSHLQKCPEYAAWRAAGNGQELAPLNPYNAAGRRFLSDSNKGLVSTSRLQSTVDMSKDFDEFVDDSAVHKNTAVWTDASPSLDPKVNHCETAPGGSSPKILPPLAETPSLAQHLLAQAEDLLTNSTQHTFLSHAGCGLLTASALNQWLTQIGYISRSLVSFTGALIGKIRIPEIEDFERDSTFRSLDLLCSAVNNVKEELEFLEAAKRKYGLEVSFDEPKPPTKSFVDLFNSASCPSATLLEGMVMLWAIETLFHSSFSYAARFVTRTVPISPLPPEASAGPNGVQQKLKDSHTAALREAFIENWKSENFGCFVSACRSIVDELAMVQPPGNGWDEMSACERVFKQAVLLWGQMFSEVMGMEEQDGLGGGQNIRERGDNGA